MTLSSYKYIISPYLEKCGDIQLDNKEIKSFETVFNFIFEEVEFAFEKDTGTSINHVTMEFINSSLPYACIRNCLGDYQISFSKGMKELLYAFSFLCVIGYQYNCYLSQNEEDSESWKIYIKVFQNIKKLLDNFFVARTYEFDLIKALEELEVCFVHELQEWSYQAHEIFEGIIRFILAHELSHIVESELESKVKQEENADSLAIRI